jgi:hypothetical protein
MSALESGVIQLRWMVPGAMRRYRTDWENRIFDCLRAARRYTHSMPG